MSASEEQAIERELDPPFTILRPAGPPTPFVFCSPHSGRIYTEHFLSKSRLDPVSLRRSEDYYVDELFASVADYGVPLLAARFPRAYLDVNREPYELDPELFHDVLPDWANAQSIRVVGGLGTIARIVADGEEIYRAPLRLEDALTRIDRLYWPFHKALEALIEDAKRQFGYAVLVDCHSMPSALVAQSAGQRPDMVLGDRFGTSCDPRLTRFLRAALAGLGYDVQMNRPYAGGYITEHYGRPLRGIHAIQIEVNRGLYVNERTLVRTAGFGELSNNLARLAARIATEVPLLMERKAAAE
ncbi:MAG: N-formylglutamate amidohydrolase [Hyphomicrobium sp.]|nr:N-formylglutamate amidohydrolase [Hyphomicrobium sp.]